MTTKQMLDLLKLDKFIGISKEIDIAKGYNKIPRKITEAIDQTRRKWKRK